MPEFALPPIRARSLAVSLLALLAGCVSAPRESVATEFGLVRASTQEAAAVAALRLEELAPRVRTLLPGLVDEPVELWLLDVFEADRDPEQEAYTWVDRRRIHIHRDNRFFDFALAHELVHAWVDGPWRALPGIAEEALADQVGTELAPRDRTSVRASRFFGLRAPWARLDLRLELRFPAAPGGVQLGRRVMGNLSIDGGELTREWTTDEAFGVSARELAQLDGRADRLHLRGLGFFVVERALERIGYRGLFALCEAAGRGGRVPWRELTRAADLADDPEEWRPVFLSQWGREELSALSVAIAEDLAHVLADWIRPERGLGIDLEGLDARMHLRATNGFVELLEVPEVRAALERELARDPVAQE